MVVVVVVVQFVPGWRCLIQALALRMVAACRLGVLVSVVVPLHPCASRIPAATCAVLRVRPLRFAGPLFPWQQRIVLRRQIEEEEEEA